MSSSNAVFDVSFMFIDQMFQDLASTELKTASVWKLAPRFDRLDKQILLSLVWKTSAFVVTVVQQFQTEGTISSISKVSVILFPVTQPLSPPTSKTATA